LGVLRLVDDLQPDRLDVDVVEVQPEMLPAFFQTEGRGGDREAVLPLLRGALPEATRVLVG
jgi:hypothetical protein